jgi:hypothetical protein
MASAVCVSLNSAVCWVMTFSYFIWFAECALRFLPPPMIGSPTILGQLRSQSGQVAFGSRNQ